MSDWQPSLVREERLRALDARLGAAPEAIELRVERAGLLVALGRADEAKQAYLDILHRDAGHFGALNDLGTLLYATGYRRAARTAYGQAVACHPGNPIGLVNLANLLLAEGEIAAARGHYETALRLDPDQAEAHQGLARLLADLGEEDAAERHRMLGFRGRAVTILPYRGRAAPIPVLLLVSTRGGNIPTRHLLDDTVFLTTALAPEFYDKTIPLPEHRLVFNAIGDADRCGAALDAAEAVLAQTMMPILNPPSRVRLTGRVANAQSLGRLPGVIAPRMALLPRDILLGADAARVLGEQGFRFPLLLRSPGFHTGRHFQRVEGDGAIPAAVAGLPGQELAVIQYLDAADAEGWSRKYRVMIVDGQLYPSHLAISTQWKVHYFTAGMADHPEHRAEEAAFLDDLAGIVGARGMAALGSIRDALGLDYAGIDFALGKGGEILLFEANATMVVNPPEPDECWAYRRAPIARILAAVRRLLLGRAAPAIAAVPSARL